MTSLHLSIYFQADNAQDMFSTQKLVRVACFTLIEGTGLIPRPCRLSDGKKSGSRLGFGERKPTHQSSATAILSESEENLAEGSSPASSTFNRPEFSEKQKKMNIVVSRRVEVNSSQGDVEAQTKLPYSTHKDSF